MCGFAITAHAETIILNHLTGGCLYKQPLFNFSGKNAGPGSG